MIKFKIEGEPCVKQRPRFSKMGNFVKTYNPPANATPFKASKTIFAILSTSFELEGLISSSNACCVFFLLNDVGTLK